MLKCGTFIDMNEWLIKLNSPFSDFSLDVFIQENFPQSWCHGQSLPWRHNGWDGVLNHQPHGCLLNRSFRNRSKKTSKLSFTGLCAGNSPVTGEFPAQMASNVENVSIWWRHHDVLWVNSSDTEELSRLRYMFGILSVEIQYQSEMRYGLHWAHAPYNKPNITYLLLMMTSDYSSTIVQYHCCWCPGFLCPKAIGPTLHLICYLARARPVHQDINSNGITYVG